MNRTHVVGIAVVGAAAASLLGVVFPWWVVMIVQVLSAGVASWTTFTCHSREITRHNSATDLVRQATRSTMSLMVWVVRWHPDVKRWQLVVTEGAPVRAWRTGPRYVPQESDVGPNSYWIDTWEDPSGGRRDAGLAAALASPDIASRWLARVNGRTYDTEAARLNDTDVICVTLDVTVAEQEGALRGREDVLAVARDLDLGAFDVNA